MIRFTVNDMTCGHWWIESRHPAEEFREAITEAGYTPVPADEAR